MDTDHATVDSVDDAARFLSDICIPTYQGRDYLGLKLPSAEAFACLLHRDKMLHDTLKRCHRRGLGFDSFWSLLQRACILQYGMQSKKEFSGLQLGLVYYSPHFQTTGQQQ